MSISRNEALEALGEVERAEARSLDARVYRTGGAQLIGWGVAWMIGYGLEGVRPAWAAAAWPLLILGGVVFSFAVARMGGRRGSAGAWRWAVAGLSVVLFFWGAYALLPVTSPDQASAFPALVLAFAYTLAGALRFTRFLLIGAGVFVLTMAGYFLLRPVLDLWLAAVGGCALVLGGAWLMRA